MDPTALARTYSEALLGDVIPFWERHSIDRACGGFLTCLARDGRVYDTDKFMWLQGRQTWTFAMLHNRVERRAAWLDIARHGADFLRRHGTDADGNFHFSLDRRGRPLTQAHSIFSDCFAAMGLGEYARAAGDEACRDLARRTYANILRRSPDPKGRFAKAVPGARPLTSLVMPMILSNLTLELEWLLEPALVEQVLDQSLHTVMDLCLDRRRGLVFENVNPDGTHPDCMDGRVVSPGHGIEAMWFMMDIAARRGDKVLAGRCLDAVLSTLEFGWDREHGGIFYFRDSEGLPIDRLDWDRKLWWVHLETLVALLKGLALTGRDDCRQWFERVHQYTWSHFPDPAHGEWYGYLDRRGQPLHDLKGGKWKGCFHVPRSLLLCQRALEQIAATTSKDTP